MADKACTKCGATKPLNEFYLNCYGRNGPCKQCVRDKNRAYYQQKATQISGKHAERRKAHAVADKGALAKRRDRPSRRDTKSAGKSLTRTRGSDGQKAAATVRR